VALALAAGCSSSNSGGGAALGSSAPGTAHGGAALAFDGPSTLEIAPGALHEVAVSASPPGAYLVRFALLGDALDASLDRASLTTGADGRGSVTLRAPDTATTFRLRAAIEDGPSAEAQVSVSDHGFGTVEVVPVYTGKRAHPTWTAVVVARATCASLQPILPADPPGAMLATSAADPVVDGAPVGPSLAVAIRSGHAMWGCTDTSDLAANQKLSVKVNVVDRPIDLSTTELDLSFAYAPDPAAYESLLATSTNLVVDTAFPAGAEAATLLDAMAAGLAKADADAFAKQRAVAGWDASLEAKLADPASGLRYWMHAFAHAGLASQSPTMTARLTAIPGADGHALLELQRLGDVDASAAGVPAAHLVSWTANPDDTLQLGATLYWLPSRFVGAAALGSAKLALPAVKTMSDALATLASCSSVAAALGGAGACDVGCLESLCQDAMTARWALGLDASIVAGQVGDISVAATAAAELDDDARPTGFSGTWLGAVADGTASAAVQGAVTAVSPKNATPH
jgi:hypothetical protein